jgi:hypothetical protein
VAILLCSATPGARAEKPSGPSHFKFRIPVTASHYLPASQSHEQVVAAIIDDDRYSLVCGYSMFRKSRLGRVDSHIFQSLILPGAYRGTILADHSSPGTLNRKYDILVNQQIYLKCRAAGATD